MPVKKRFLKSRPAVKVTFEVDKAAAGSADKIYLLAEFNDWQPHALTRLKSGKFKTTLDVPTNKKGSYEYRYQLEEKEGETRFDNDWQADAYCPNAFGSENSVLLVAAPAST